MKLELIQLVHSIPISSRCIFRDRALEHLFEKHTDSIMKIVETEISEYVNNEFLCNDMEDMFPRKCYLTGEWYIHEIYFDRIDYLAVKTALVGTDLGYKDDYLGLEVILYYDEKTDEFRFYTINSEAL